MPNTKRISKILINYLSYISLSVFVDVSENIKLNEPERKKLGSLGK